MKKIAFVMLGLTAILLMGCSSQSEKVATEAQETEKEKLVIWSYYEVDEQQKSLDKLVHDFNISQKHYEASWEYIPMTDFTKRLSMGFTEKELPDIVIIDNPDMRTYINFGLFEDITDYMVKKEDIVDYYPEVISSCIYNGRYYGLPFCCNNLALYYNKDLFEEAELKPPKTWEEFVAAAKELTRDKTFGFAMSAIDSEEGAYQFLPWILSTGTAVTEVGDQDAVRAYSLIDNLVNDGSLSTECINWTQIDVARKFISGEAAMIENGPWVLSMLKDSGINFGIVELPSDKRSITILGGENLAVIKGSNVKGAMAFLDYYSQEKEMLEICQASNAIVPKRNLAIENYSQDPYYSVFVGQMDYGISRSSYPSWKMISGVLNEALYDIIIKNTPVQDIGDQVIEKLNKAK
ncbi:MAG TPA: extracellular solute-binding protein [Clostridiales bacterium]|nr:extracellular solute-binding protein [Clostridiales bacterium]